MQQDELSVRQTAIRLRLAGENVESICRTLKRSKTWFHKWWRRYLESGPEGLYDLTRGNHQVVNRTPPHIERAVISIRRRLAARATPQTRYSRIGAVQIRAELEALEYSPLPGIRTINRIIARAGLSCPPLRAIILENSPGAIFSVPLNMRCSRKCAMPDFPFGSSAAPVRYHTMCVTTGAR